MSENVVSLYSDVKAEAIRWLWYPYFALGKITLLQGDPGDGKSTMMMHLIAEITRGGIAPDGTRFGLPQRAIYQCSEDGVADTIKPRLQESGADCSKVAFLNEEQLGNITLDDERLRQAIIEFKPSLVVIDPIQAYLKNDADLQTAGKARKLTQRLGMWAAAYGQIYESISSICFLFVFFNHIFAGKGFAFGTVSFDVCINNSHNHISKYCE